MIFRVRGNTACVARNPFTTAELVPRYLVTLVTLVTAAVAGVITTFGSARFLASRGGQHPVDALLAGEAVALAVLVVVAFVTARRTDSDTIERICRHILWGTFVVAAVPGLGWFVLWPSGGSPQALLGLVAIVVGSFPLVAAYRRRSALPTVVGCCLLVPVVMLALWGWHCGVGTVGLALWGWHWGDGCSCCCRSRWRSPSAGHSFSP